MTIKSICQNCQKPKAFIKDNYKTISIAIALILSVGLIVGYACEFSLGLWGALGTTTLFLIITSMRCHYPKKKQSPSSKSPSLNNKKKPMSSSSKTPSTAAAVSSAPSSIERPPSTSSTPISRNPQTPSSSTPPVTSTPSPSPPSSVLIPPTAPVVPRSNVVVFFEGGQDREVYNDVPDTDCVSEYIARWRSKHVVFPSSVSDHHFLLNGRGWDPSFRIANLPINPVSKNRVIHLSFPR